MGTDSLLRAVKHVEDYVQDIQDATKIADTRQLLLVALLNQTMEMEQMEKNENNAGADPIALVEWATNLTGTVRTVLD